MKTTAAASGGGGGAAQQQQQQSTTPRRFIYNDVDMEKFLQSPAKAELLRVTAAMGRSCATATDTGTASQRYEYDPASPLVGLTPPLACLHGSLRGMMSWIDDYPPSQGDRGRFGNPMFRRWHERLVIRSVPIVHRIIQIYQREKEKADDEEEEGSNTASDDNNQSGDGGGGGGEREYDLAALREASEEGYRAATAATPEQPSLDDIGDPQIRCVVAELCAYLCAAFGHEVRIDYGTGHECSFQVFLFALCKLGCFAPGGGGTSNKSSSAPPPSQRRLKAATISIYSAYLPLTRQLQTQYMLEPAGSHGVWGLDDYHCLPFYFGACQLSSAAAASDHDDLQSPSSIHNDSILQREGDRYLYYGCIRYIKQLKRGVPFFESSPMLNDISHIPTWQKVASGLLKLFEGEVLKKRQVVQHFVFGNIFSANWTPDEGEGRNAPSATFRGNAPAAAAAADAGTRAPWATSTGGAAAVAGAGPVGPMARAPWNDDTGNPPSSPVSSPSRGGRPTLNVDADALAAGLVTTRAPWATDGGGGSASGAGGSGSAGSTSDSRVDGNYGAEPQQHPDMPPPPTRAPWAK